MGSRPVDQPGQGRGVASEFNVLGHQLPTGVTHPQRGLRSVASRSAARARPAGSPGTHSSPVQPPAMISPIFGRLVDTVATRRPGTESTPSAPLPSIRRRPPRWAGRIGRLPRRLDLRTEPRNRNRTVGTSSSTNAASSSRSPHRSNGKRQPGPILAPVYTRTVGLKTTLAFLPGLLGDAQTWAPVIGALPD